MARSPCSSVMGSRGSGVCWRLHPEAALSSLNTFDDLGIRRRSHVCSTCFLTRCCLVDFCLFPVQSLSLCRFSFSALVPGKLLDGSLLGFVFELQSGWIISTPDRWACP